MFWVSTEARCPHWLELQRQKTTCLLLRIAAEKDNKAILKLTAQGKIIADPGDILRDPFVFKFLKVPGSYGVAVSYGFASNLSGGRF